MADYQQICGESIDRAAMQIESYLKSQRVDRPTALRIRIAAETALLKYAEVFGTSAQYRLTCEKKFGRLRITLTVPGTSLDPFADGEETEYVRQIMQTMSAAPVWTYRRGVNSLVFSPDVRRKIPEVVWILLAAAMGIGLGALAGLLPDAPRTALCDRWLSPVSSAIMGLVSALSVGMVFVSIANGICGMGDLATFKRIGRRLLLRFLLILLVCAFFAVGMGLLLTPVGAGEGGGFQLASLWQTILNIVPTNLVEPFLTGNALQVIFLSFSAGIVLLILNSRVVELTAWIGQAEQLLLTFLRGVIRLMPLVVFISLFTLTAQNELGILSSVWKFPVGMLIGIAVYWIVILLSTAATQHIRVRLLIRKLLPTFLIAASTASSSAAYAVNLDTCENKLGIDSRITGFGIPLGQTMFKICAVLESILGCMCVAELYGVPMDLSKLVSLVISALVLAVAEPSVPGALISIFTLLFAQLGIPAAGISVILAIDPLLDHLATPTNLMALQATLVRLASSMDLLNTEKLKKE